MQYVFLCLLPCLSVLKVFVQGVTAKNKIGGEKDCLVFTGLVSIVAAGFLSALFLRTLPTGQELLYAAFYALFSTGFQFFYVLAFRAGSVSITSTITSFAVVIPIVFGAFYYHTPITVFGYVSFVLIAASFVLIADRTKKEDKKTGVVWLLLTLIAFLCSGLNSAMQVIVSHTDSNVNNVVVFSYFFSAALSFLSVPFFRRQKLSLRPEKVLLIGIPVIALSLGLYNLLSVYTLKQVPETIFYTVVPGSHLVLINLIGIFFLKEKKTALQYIGLVLAVIAVVLIHF